MNHITFEKIQERAVCLEGVNPNDTYHKSYSYFVDYFNTKNIITEQDLVIGSNFTYAWMPTIMNFKSNSFNQAVDILNKAKTTEKISNEDILLLKKLINNSLVGVSKLLHFINPEVYAIWDSRVCHFLTASSYKQKVENIDRFWAYIALCERIVNDSRFDDIHHEFVKKIGYNISRMRTIEQIMFISSKTPLN